MIDRLRFSIAASPWPLTIVALLALQLGPLPLKAAALLTLLLVAWVAPAVLLCLVPATAPFALIPVALTESAAIPIHEFVLAVACIGWGITTIERRSLDITFRRSDIWVAVLAGSAAVSLVWALPEGRGEALRTLRWVIVEPIIWLFLMRSSLHRDRVILTTLVHSLVVSAGVIAALGILQYLGVDLVPWLGSKRVFADNVVATGNIRRVASVYGHANNLGLFLERILPLALLCTLWPVVRIRARWLWVGVIALGIVVSFSRGAWLATLVAGAVIAVYHYGADTIRRRPWIIGAILLAGIAGIALTLVTRGASAGSFDARILLWQEAIRWIQLRPWGLGLGQFYFYHNPEYGHSIIDPVLVGTSEQYAAHPHNLLLDAWLNLGPAGVLALGALVVTTIRRAVQQQSPLAPVVLAIVLGTVVHGMVDQFFFVTDLALCFWVVVFLGQVDTGHSTRL